MDSGTLQLIGAGALIAVLGIAAVISSRLKERRVARLGSGDENPLPHVEIHALSKAELAARTAFVMKQVNDFSQIAWGSDSLGDRKQAEHIYQSALDALSDAEGDFRKYLPIIREMQHLPRDLALSGAAAVLLRLGYLQIGEYIPEGVRAALSYTSVAVKAAPISVDAWIMRLYVACSVRDSTYRIIASAALEKVRILNPNHPRFPDAESKYYSLYGTTAQYEAAARRMIDLAPSQVSKRAGYDRLAHLYAATNRQDEAIATYQQLFREEPEGSAWTWHNYSMYLLRAKRYHEALDASNRALSFFEFSNARSINNKAREALGMPVAAQIRMDA